MKKISSLLLTILCFPYVLTGCDSSNGVKDEKIDFFSTTEFTIDSFISAVKEYGTESDGYYGLSNAQSVACYSNDSIKRLLTSANYGVMSNEKINANTLWKVMYEDIFSKNVTYTLDSFFDTVNNKCVWISINVPCVYFIGSAENYMANNDSIVSLCKNDGYGVYSKFTSGYASGYELYDLDLIDLYMKTNTWINNNANIAYTINTYSGYYPFAFRASFWAGKDFEYEGNGYSFGDTSTYEKLVSKVKSYLKDPDSYQSNGNIEFYSTSGNPVSNGYYTGKVYAGVPFRAKNSFGGYVTDVVWLTYNWNSQSFSFYGRDMPLSINSYPFETGYLN